MIPTSLLSAEHLLTLNSPLVMGILNITPDSFSDGGLYLIKEKALRQVERMLSEGADIIDIGGESTRPGAKKVSAMEELDRVIPIIELLQQQFDIPISIDTNKAVVMTEAAQAGAALINDVMALQNDGALKAAQQTGLPICLMHMQGQPKTMQTEPSYQNVVEEVSTFLLQRIEQCQQYGIDKNQLIIDPGFGFGKTLTHNISLFKQLEKLKTLGYPVLVGASRKTMIAQITGKKALEQRVSGSLALACLAALKGVSIIRVHDVAQTIDVLKVVQALNG
jgi:dihydropteroate synthase